MFIGKDADFPLVGLRLIHRDVGISEELIGRAAAVGDRDSEAGGERKFVAGEFQVGRIIIDGVHHVVAYSVGWDDTRPVSDQGDADTGEPDPWPPGCWADAGANYIGVPGPHAGANHGLFGVCASAQRV